MKLRDITLPALIFAIIVYLLKTMIEGQQKQLEVNTSAIQQIMADAAERATKLVMPPPPEPVEYQDRGASIDMGTVPDPFDNFPLPTYDDNRIVWGDPVALPADHSPML